MLGEVENLTDVFTLCPICGIEFRYEAGLYDAQMAIHLKEQHNLAQICDQLSHLWFGMARQVVEDDIFVKEVISQKSESDLHKADKCKTRADTLSKIMNDWRFYKR